MCAFMCCLGLRVRHPCWLHVCVFVRCALTAFSQGVVQSQSLLWSLGSLATLFVRLSVVFNVLFLLLLRCWCHDRGPSQEVRTLRCYQSHTPIFTVIYLIEANFDSDFD